MNKQQLKEIIIDQIETYLNLDYIKRDFQLDKNINYCFVGIRKCGKSYLMYQLAHELIYSGIGRNQIIYVNFEDERLLEFTSSDFNTILEIALELSGNSGKPYLFLDEIQNITGWDKFARRVSDMKYHINITGSNSKMLSKEIASTLGGRFMILDVYPYSFNEFLKAKKVENDKNRITTKDKATLSANFNQYLIYGGFPELVDIDNKRNYLNNIYQTIYLGDVVTHNKLDNSFALRLIIKKIAEAVMKPISYSRLFGIVSSSGAQIGKQTVINYIGYSLDSFLIFEIQNYAAKLVEKETAPKYYFMDQGLLGIFGKQDVLSSQLENVVAIELIRRYGKNNVYYFEKNVETDFYIPSENLAIQVCYELFNNIETYERETGAFVKLKSHFEDTKCLILTMDDEDCINIENINIKVMPIWKWLTEE